jgi:hypothetical protein
MTGPEFRAPTGFFPLLIYIKTRVLRDFYFAIYPGVKHFVFVIIYITCASIVHSWHLHSFILSRRIQASTVLPKFISFIYTAFRIRSFKVKVFLLQCNMYNIVVVPLSNLREFSLFGASLSNQHCPLFGVSMLPTSWVKISTYVQLEPFLSVAFI